MARRPSSALVTLEPNRSIEHLLPAGDRAFFYVITGGVTVAGRPVASGQIAWSDPVRGASASSDPVSSAKSPGEAAWNIRDPPLINTDGAVEMCAVASDASVRRVLR